MQTATITLTDFIEANLHRFTPTHPLIVPFSNIRITSADFDRVSEGATLGEILSYPAESARVAPLLATIALLNLFDAKQLSSGKMVYADFVTSAPTKYMQAPNRIIMVVEHPDHWSVYDCADYGISTGAKIKWVQNCVSRADALSLARYWATSYTD